MDISLCSISWAAYFVFSFKNLGRPKLKPTPTYAFIDFM